MESSEVAALSGCYLLVVLGEPICDNHKERIAQRVAKGLLSWNTETTQCDLKNLERVCDNLKGNEQESLETELLLQHATDRLAVEVLFNPQIFTLKQCLRNSLLSPTGHKHIIFAGYSFNGSGSWILQDGIFRFNDFIDELSDPSVIKVLSLNPTGHPVKMHLHCAPVGDWIINNLEDQSFSHLLNISLNPPDSPNGVPGASYLLEFIETALVTLTKESHLESSKLVGNIKFERPTMYIFPSGQGDCSLLGITGFTMLIDGGFPRFPCFWKFIRHIERIDSILITRINESNVWGILSLMKGKQEYCMFPKIGYVFCNMGDKKSSEDVKTANGFRENGKLQNIQHNPNDLIISLVDVGNEIVTRMGCIGCNPHRCLRETPPNPLTLYQKLGHGTLEMYVLNPSKDSRLLKEFLSVWNSGKDHLPVVRTRSALKKNDQSGLDIAVPIADVMSICCLIVWRPSDPSDQITRILFPGSAPQSQVMMGLAMLKGMDLLTSRVCTRSSLETQKQKKTATKPSSAGKPENMNGSSTRYRSVSPAIIKSRVNYAKQFPIDAVVKNEDSSESQSSPIKRKIKTSLAQKADNSRTSTREPAKKTVLIDKKREIHKREGRTRNATSSCSPEVKSYETTSDVLENRPQPLQAKHVRSRVSTKQTVIRKSEKVVNNIKTKDPRTDDVKSGSIDDRVVVDAVETCEDASPRKLPFLDLLRDEVEPDSLEYYDLSGNVEISQDSLEHSEDGVMTNDSNSSPQLDQSLPREYDTEIKSSPSPIQCEQELQSDMTSSLSPNLSEKTIISGDRNGDSTSDLELASLTMRNDCKTITLSFDDPIDGVDNDAEQTKDDAVILQSETTKNHSTGNDLKETERGESVITEIGPVLHLPNDLCASKKADNSGGCRTDRNDSDGSTIETDNKRKESLQQDEIENMSESSKEENKISVWTNYDKERLTKSEENAMIMANKDLMQEQSVTKTTKGSGSEVETTKHLPLGPSVETKKSDAANTREVQLDIDKDSTYEPKIPGNKLSQVREDIKCISVDLMSADASSGEIVPDPNASLHKKEPLDEKEEYLLSNMLEKSSKRKEENALEASEIKAGKGEVDNQKLIGSAGTAESKIDEIDAETKSILIEKKTTSDTGFADKSDNLSSDEMSASSWTKPPVTEANSVLSETLVTKLAQRDVEAKRILPSLAGEAMAESQVEHIVESLPETISLTTEEMKFCTKLSEQDTTIHIPNDNMNSETDTTAVEVDAISVIKCETDGGDTGHTTIVETKRMSMPGINEIDIKESSQKTITGTDQQKTFLESVQTPTSPTDSLIEGSQHKNVENVVLSPETAPGINTLDYKIDEKAEMSRQSNVDSTIHDAVCHAYSTGIASQTQIHSHYDDSENPSAFFKTEKNVYPGILHNEETCNPCKPPTSSTDYSQNYSKQDFSCEQKTSASQLYCANAHKMRDETTDCVLSAENPAKTTASPRISTVESDNTNFQFSETTKEEIGSDKNEISTQSKFFDTEGATAIQNRSAKFEDHSSFELHDQEKTGSLLPIKGHIGLSHETVETKEYPEVLHIPEGVTPASPEVINETVNSLMIVQTASSSEATSIHDTESMLCCFPKVPEMEDKEERSPKEFKETRSSDTFKSQFLTEQQLKHKEDTLKEWGNPLGLPKPPKSSDYKNPKSRAKSSDRTEYSNIQSPTCDLLKPVYLDLAYVPNHGDRHYCNAEYFKRIRARYYVLSGVNPSKDVLDALIIGKQSWEDRNVETTLIPSHESEVLCLWMAANQKTLEMLNIEVAPSASRCSVVLQGQDSSCSAYRVEF